MGRGGNVTGVEFGRYVLGGEGEIGVEVGGGGHGPSGVWILSYVYALSILS